MLGEPGDVRSGQSTTSRGMSSTVRNSSTTELNRRTSERFRRHGPSEVLHGDPAIVAELARLRAENRSPLAPA